MLITFLLTNNYNIKSALALINRGMDKKMNLVYRMEYYTAIKRKRRHTICRKSDVHGNIVLKKYASLKRQIFYIFSLRELIF